MEPISLPDLAGLAAERSRLSGALLAPLTEQGYAGDFRLFDHWCKGIGRDSLPASTDTVTLYLTDLLQSGHEVTTANRRATAIVNRHRRAGYASPVDASVRALLLGCQRLRAEQPKQTRALSIAHLRAIAESLMPPQGKTDVRDRAILVIGFTSALRRSNLAALTMEDIELDDRGVVLHIRKEKQDQEGKGRLIGLPRGKRVATCPLRTVEAWLKVRGWGPGPFFTRLDTKSGDLDRLTGQAIGRIVRKLVGRIGLGPGYGAHSLRSGFVTAAVEVGVHELLIAAQTGHRSIFVLRKYFRRTELFKANAAAALDL